jgi:dienelactone hydrolase
MEYPSMSGPNKANPIPSVSGRSSSETASAISLSQCSTRRRYGITRRQISTYRSSSICISTRTPTSQGLTQDIRWWCSHTGAAPNPLQYAWCAETLASHGYIVAAPYHYRANTYDSTIAYLANKLWQRPLDISFDITALLNDPAWGKRVDAARIGIAGHSQGDFTSLWIGGAKVNADKYLAFQKGWKNNPSVPTYITVSARDTQAPPGDNAEFAAKHIPHAELSIIPGDVDHEIFINECDHEGRDEFPEACIERRA